MNSTPEKPKVRHDEQPNMWQQIPIATKLYFGLIFGLCFLLLLLVAIRIDFFSFEWIDIKMETFVKWLPSFKNEVDMIATPIPESISVQSSEATDIRSGPGEQFEILGIMDPGKQAEVIGVNSNQQWIAIRLTGDIQTGWIDMLAIDDLDRNGLPKLDENGNVVTQVDSGEPMVVALEDTNIFNSPSSDASIVGIIEAGEIVTLIGRESEGLWYVIQIPYIEGGQGWIIANKVSIQNGDNLPVFTPAPDQLSDNNAVAIAATVTAIANINIRSGPGLGYNKIGMIANGEQANVVGIDNTKVWLAIQIPSDPAVRGWISLDYVVPQDVDEIPIIELSDKNGILIIPTPRANSPKATAVTMVNIRSGPGLQFAVLGRLEPGQSAEIIGISPDKAWWVIKISFADNERGWVAINFVQSQNTDGVPIIQ